MKKKILPISAILLLILFFVKYQTDKKFAKEKNPKPTETIIVDKDKEDGGKARKEWVEKMHRAAPGTNWREMDLNTRIAKAKNRKSLLKSTNGDVKLSSGEPLGNWRETGSNNQSGRTHQVEYDPIQDSIYCASSGGNIWKASKIGAGWRCLNDGFKIPDIKMIRKIETGTDYRLLVSSGAWGVPGFWFSDDDGITWESSIGLSGIANWGTVIRTIVANNSEKTIYLLAKEWDYANWEVATCIYVSNDKGISFSKKQTFLSSMYGSENNFDIWTDPDGTPIVYLVENNNVNYLDANYSPVLIGIVSYSTSGDILLSGCETASETYLYIGVYANSNADFYQSSDAGATWTQKGSAPTNPFMKNSFTVSQKEPNTLYYGGLECYRSINGAGTWTKINTWSSYYSDIVNNLHADIPGINSFIDASDNEFVYVNTDGGTYISYDALANVENISLNDLNVSQLYSVYTHKTNTNYVFGGSQDQGYQLCNSNDGVGIENFTQILSGDYGHIVSGDGGNSIWMVYPGFAAYFPYATSSYYSSEWWNFTCSGQYWMPPLMEDPNFPNKVFLGGGTNSSGTHLFHLTYTGSSVNHSELAYDFSGTTGATSIAAMAYSPINTDYRYVMNGNGEFFTTTNGGTSWTLTTGFDGPGGYYMYGAVIVPSQTELGKVFVGGSGYSNPPVFASTDNGSNFSAIDTGIPNTMVFDMAITPNDAYLFAATEVGPYVYVMEDNEWYDLAQNVAPDQTYWSVDYVSLTKTVRFGTYGRGIWDFNIESAVSVEDIRNSTVVNVFPNPTSNYITITNFTGTIEIYDLSGKLVKQTQETKIDVSSFQEGVYVIKTDDVSLKFIKE